MSKIKGQNVTINSILVADETNCTVTVTGNTEDVTTKGDASLFSKDTMTSKSWQVQVDTYQAEASQLQAILTAFIGAAPVAVGWNVAGASDANGSGQALPSSEDRTPHTSAEWPGPTTSSACSGSHAALLDGFVNTVLHRRWKSGISRSHTCLPSHLPSLLTELFPSLLHFHPRASG